MCPINIKMAELIGPKFCVGPYITQGIYLIKCDQALSYIYFYFNRFIFIIKSCMKCADFNILIYISLFFLSMHVKYPWGKGSQLSDVRTTVGHIKLWNRKTKFRQHCSSLKIMYTAQLLCFMFICLIKI